MSLYYKLNGQENVLQENVSNTAKDSWLPFSHDISLTGVVVEDTTGIPKDWQLKVKQTTSFSDGTRDLPAQLTYLNGEEKLLINNNPEVGLPVVQNNATDYSLQQDANHQFQLAVSPGAYTGEYQSQLEWTIERAP